jgi:hypothetical protein
LEIEFPTLDMWNAWKSKNLEAWVIEVSMQAKQECRFHFLASLD